VFVLKISAQMVWLPVNYLLLFSLNKQFLKKHKYWILGGLAAVVIINFYFTNTQQHYYVLITHVFLLFLFIRLLVTEIYKSNIVSIFYVVIIFYETLIILRFFPMILNLELGVNIFYVGIIFQILISIVLIIVKDKYKIKLGSE
jgi:hypothetical protein